jgi:hypothetical protein
LDKGDKKVRNTHLHTRTSAPEAAAPTKAAGQDKVADAQSAKLRAMGGKLGNQAVDEKLAAASGTQKALLDHICERLKTIHGVQDAERSEIKDVRDWFKEVSKGTSGYAKPDPTRWHEVAKIYMQAAQALCQGQLGRGAMLLERAAEVEEATFATLPVQVREKLNAQEQSAAAAPTEAHGVVTHAGAPRCDRPKDLIWGERILSVHDTLDNAPPFRASKRKWYESPEEEEEEEDGKNA